jgi:hypothetical protein
MTNLRTLPSAAMQIDVRQLDRILCATLIWRAFPVPEMAQMAWKRAQKDRAFARTFVAAWRGGEADEASTADLSHMLRDIGI